MHLNPYEESELESRDLLCISCGKEISTQEYIRNEGLCDDCSE